MIVLACIVMAYKVMAKRDGDIDSYLYDVRACVRACMRACVRACVCTCMHP